MTKRRLCCMLGVYLIPLLTSTVNGWRALRAEQPVASDATHAVYVPLILKEETRLTYLPLVLNGAPTQTFFGVQPFAPNTFNALLAPLNVGWLRLVGPSWNEVEPVQGGGYNWDVPSVRNIETALAALQRDGISANVILMTLGSPSWATDDASICGAIKPEYHDDYARFMDAAIRRFPTIQYWEIANEPDIDVEDVNPASGFGCWGDKDDAFYGGRAYGEMLKVVYPAVKQANPSAQVLNGGLLLDRPYDPATGSNPSARFLEGVFVAGAGSSFDIVNYHFYTYYTPSALTPYGESTVGSGAVDWKARYLRDLMQRYGVPEKPLINTETALLCYVDASLRDACRNAQANNVGRVYARAAHDRLLAASWYSFSSDSFNFTAFFDRATRKVWPVYNAYKHANAMFGGATFLGTLDGQQEGVEGYRFKNGSLTVTIFWSDQQGKTATISVPVGSTPRCTDRDGQPLACENQNGTVSLPATPESHYVLAP